MQDKILPTPLFQGHSEHHDQTQPFFDWKGLSKSLTLSLIPDSGPNTGISAAIYNKKWKHTGRVLGKALLVSLLSFE
jgi:hypothetical protein